MDVHRHRSGCGPDHEEPTDRRHVEQDDVLQPERVRGLQGEEAEQQHERPDAEDRGERDRHCDEDERRPHGGPLRQLAARDRPQPLHRMPPVEIGVAQVVQQVRGARGGAVGDEGDERLHPLLPHADLRCEDDACENERVLRPLPRTQGDERGVRPAARERELECLDNRHRRGC